MNRIIFLIFPLILMSCSSINPLSLLNPNKPSLEVSAQVGKTNEQEKNNIKVEEGKTEIKQDAESITNDTHYTADRIENITQGMSKIELILLVFLAGWAIPTPQQTLQGVKRVVSDTVCILIITPLKAIGDFILKLLGRK